MSRREALIMLLVALLFSVFYFLSNFLALFHKHPVKDIDDFEELISEISEMIIPRSETPGAKDALVAGFIINVVRNCWGRRRQLRFISGLESLEAASQKRFSSSFASSSNENKTMLLNELERQKLPHPFLQKIKDKVFGHSFFEDIKILTAKAYCMSEQGATRGLVYDPVPASFISCVPYYPNQRSWATR